MFLAVHARRERIPLLLAIAGVALLAGIAVALS